MQRNGEADETFAPLFYQQLQGSEYAVVEAAPPRHGSSSAVAVHVVACARRNTADIKRFVCLVIVPLFAHLLKYASARVDSKIKFILSELSTSMQCWLMFIQIFILKLMKMKGKYGMVLDQ